MTQSFRLSTLCTLASLLTTAAGRVWYVHPDSALNSIQVALNSCSTGDTVLVGAGTYREAIVWPARAGLVLMSEAGYGATAIDGENRRSGITMSRVPEPSPVIRGFTFMNCFSSLNGGAILAENCSPLIIDNWFEGNAARQAGAIYCAEGNPIIRRCTFLYNASMQFPPGAIGLGQNCAALVESCSVTGSLGGGIAFTSGILTVIRHCNISGNYGYGVLATGAGADTADAKFNWWGDSTGPYHRLHNPRGRGDSISDRVDFSPWLFSPIGVAEPESGNRSSRPSGSIIRSVLLLGEDSGGADGSAWLLDITGRRIMPLVRGTNDLRGLPAGVYFVTSAGYAARVVIIR